MIRLLLLFCVLFRAELALVRDEEFYVHDAESDRIVSLPGVTQMPDFPMYSGYLDVSIGKKMHYWLNICEDETCDVLIVWFNGGPGCSSLDGLMTEHGPYKFDSVTGRVVRNEYSWNKLGHTLYIESPGGVGFSLDNTGGMVTDDTVAEDTLRALLSFFEKFPSMADCELYISGESYAGVYIPTLVALIMDNQPTLRDRIKGLVIGNGLMSQEANEQSMIYYAYYHGLFGEDTWNMLMENCCEDGRPDECDFYQFKHTGCMMQVVKVTNFILNGGVNMYNLYQDCAPPEAQKSMNYFKKSLQNRLWTEMQKLLRDENAKEVFSYQQSPLQLVPVCSNATLITEYFNRPDVQQAIHVSSTRWEICSDTVHGQYKKVYPDTSNFLRRILSQEMDARVLLYFGDVDMACNHLGGEWFANQLGFEVTLPRKSWSIERDGSEQIAGFVKQFGKLTYATIKGAGHMAPTDDPYASFQMLERFIDDLPF